LGDDCGPCGDRLDEGWRRRHPWDPRLDSAVIDRETGYGDLRVGMLGIDLCAGLAEIARRTGFEVDDDAQEFYTPTLSY
jgi:hypothetical protein